MKILFVCTANICRSYMAERILKGMLQKVNRYDVEVQSAALYDMKGAVSDPIACKLLMEHGFSAEPQVSKLLDSDLVGGTDAIIVMETAHQEAIAGSYPESTGRIRLLKSYANKFRGDDQDIRDCFKKSSYHYRLCFSEIYLSISEGLMKCI
jgi:protein-tyrosine phosphatase